MKLHFDLQYTGNQSEKLKAAAGSVLQPDSTMQSMSVLHSFICFTQFQLSDKETFSTSQMTICCCCHGYRVTLLGITFTNSHEHILLTEMFVSLHQPDCSCDSLYYRSNCYHHITSHQYYQSLS